MRKFILFVFTIVIWLTQCGFTVVGHRGNPIKQPEETIASFSSAFADGADYVELDLHVSKDNQLVISHDRDLQRITGTSAIVSQNDFSYLSTLHQANGEPIHNLSQIFEYFKNQTNTKFLIETKKTSKNNPQNMEQLLTDTIKQYHMEKRVMIHSFSYKSLASMNKLMPDIPLIFIVGSLKRINFDVLSYVDGVNISSRLVNEKLISQLHSLNKKVFVWDQMEEDPQQWNWLVNLPIDGVVTNFPSTGYQYKMAKDGTKQYKVNKDAIVVARKSLSLQENPYLNVATNELLAPFRPVHIENAVIVNHKTYYQLKSGEFIPADTVNFDLNVNNYMPYISKNLILKNGGRGTLYNSPLAPTKVVGELASQTPVAIIGMNSSGGELWLQTDKGWIQNKQVLITGIYDNLTKDIATKLYFSQKSSKRLVNISLTEEPFYFLNSNKTKFIEYLAHSSPLFTQINDRIKI